MYGHGGCNNHGCEAIVTSTVNMVGTKENEFVLSSLEKSADDTFLPKGIIKDIYPDSYTKNKLLRKFYGARRKFLRDDEIIARKTYRNFKKSLSKQPNGTVFMSIGGDNYCCEKPAWLYYSNRLIDKLGFKRVLWGCSVEPNCLGEEMVYDLNGYSLITVREKTTYDALKSKLSKPQIVYVSDPAFTIEKQDSGLKLKPNTVGINMSPVVTQRGKNDSVLKNFENLVEYIIHNTDKNILFIPHVLIRESNDYEAMKPLYEKYKNTDRVSIIENKYNYAQLRDIISQCEVLVCARTHSSISAYSMCVPTLVIGYSVKSIGIARDLFGTDEGYVVSMSKMVKGNELTDAYLNIDKNKEDIKNTLSNIMPEYKKRAYLGLDILKNLNK